MINKTIYRTTCDVKNCKNMASFSFDSKGRMGKVYLCQECLEKIASESMQMSVPKSVRNSIKRKMDEKTTIKGA